MPTIRLRKIIIKKTDSAELTEGAISGMIASLDDPYSTFMTKKESEEFDDTISSSFEGIGAEIGEEEGHIIVVSPIKNSPAEKAGIKPRDRITEVDGKSIKGQTTNQAIKKNPRQKRNNGFTYDRTRWRRETDGI